MAYEELVLLLKDKAEKFDYDGWVDTAVVMEKAADAIETLQLSVEVLVRTIAEMTEERRWIPVTEKYPDTDDDMLVTDGEDYAAGYYRPEANAWDSTNYGWLENRPEGCPCGIGTVTHWMPLPPLPEQRSEDDV